MGHIEASQRLQGKTAIPLGLAVVALLVGTVSVSACSNDDERAPALNAAELTNEWCIVLCTWMRNCGEDTPSNCASQCRWSGGFEGYGRPEFYREFMTCLEEDHRCADGADASWDYCHEQASMGVPLTQAAYDFCEVMGPTFYECGFGMAPATCARYFIEYTDETLEYLKICRNEGCDSYAKCIQTVAQGGN